MDSDPSITTGSNLPQPEKQRIIIQDYYKDTTVLTLTIQEIAKQCLISSLLDREHSESNDDAVSASSILRTAKNMGRIVSVRFLDRHTIHWNMRAGMIPSKAENFDLNALIIQFHSRIVVYSFEPVPFSITGHAKSKLNTNDNMILADITSSKLNKSNPTSTAIPALLSFVLAIGCSDGTMRFYDMITRKVIKSVRGPNGRNDPVVKIIGVNSYNYSSPFSFGDLNTNDLETIDKSMNSLSLQKRDNLDMMTMSNMNSQKTIIRSRVVTVCSAGSAFLWELIVTMDENDTMEKFRIKPPKVRMDGWGKTLSESMHVNTSGSGILSTTSAKASSVENTSVVYDPDRDFLIWSTPFAYGGSFKPHVVVWDLSPSALPSASSKQLGTDGSQKQSPLHEPFLVLQIPNTTAGSIVGGDSDIYTDLTLVSGILHPSFSDATLVTFVGSKSGDLSLMTASCSIASSLIGPSSTKITGIHETQFQKAETHYQCSLSYLRNLVSNKKVLGNLNTTPASKIRLLALAVSRFHPNLVLMKTNAGVAVVNIEESNTLVAGSRHVPVIGSGIASGHGFSNSGTGMILVENNSVFTSVLDSTSSNNEHTTVGPVLFKDPVLVYKSLNPNGNPLESNHLRRLPPRLLYSPSGNFLCLFWYAERRYEILHVGSVLRTSRIQKINGGDYSPAVDIGDDVLSFAWVGDEDVFALLHPPALSKDVLSDGSVYSTSTTAGKDKKGLKKELKKIKNTVNKLATTNQNASTSGGSVAGENDDENRNDPSLYQPSVELKVLIGINADAVEISGSVAAATSIRLGDITLRGGVRHPPTVLFGGPVLCVGSLTQDAMDDTLSDGMAFFYSRKYSADGDDNVRNSKASSYQSIGPPLPYPDLVVWDDVGSLCAVIVGRRIAIYYADPPKFILLGSVNLGAPNEVDATVESAKFLHGTLYCSTRSSVQCIFLGDLDNDDVICEIDSYSITSSEGPSYASRPFPVNGMFISESVDFEPMPYPMALNQPSILTYSNGSLIVSTVSGIQAISISHPLIRIGNLIGAGYHGRVRIFMWIKFQT